MTGHGGIHWPQGAGNWVDLVIVVLFGVYLVRKAWLMARRSTYFDRLGVALIAANAALGVAFWLTAVFTLYPPLYGVEWLRWSIRVVLGAVVVWSEFVVERSEPRRVQRAMRDG